jgi:hypothetical protein
MKQFGWSTIAAPDWWQKDSRENLTINMVSKEMPSVLRSARREHIYLFTGTSPKSGLGSNLEFSDGECDILL